MSECRGDTAGLLDRHGGTERVLQDTGQLACLLFLEVSGDLSLTSGNWILHRGGTLDFTIQQDGKPSLMRSQLLSQFEEGLGALAVEIESDPVTLLIKKSKSFGNVLAGQISLFLDEQALGDLLALVVLSVLLDKESRRQDRLPLVDLGDKCNRIGMDFRKLKLRHLLELLLGGLNLPGVEAWDLHENPAGALRSDHWLADAELVDTLANHFDCLLEHIGRDRLVVLWN